MLKRKTKKNKPTVMLSHRIGNYVIEIINGNSESSYFEIRTVSGTWIMRIDYISPMYTRFLDVCSDENFENAQSYLEMWINAMFIICNNAPDQEFLSDLVNSFHAMIERIIANMPTPTEEDDNNALDDVKTMNEIKKAIDEE